MTSTPRPLNALQMAQRTALILFLFVAVFTALLAGVQQLTAPSIAASAAAEKMRLIDEVLPRADYDNQPLNDTLMLPAAPELGLNEASTVYRARQGGKPAALILEAVAPDGYAGKIRLLIAVRADGRLAGVRVSEHHETPGLGDFIEIKKDKDKASPWITRFTGLSLDSHPAEQWRVKKDGGAFSYTAGATVTPRAVVKAIGKALVYVAENRNQLFSPTGIQP